MVADPIAQADRRIPGLTHALTSFVGRVDAIDKVAGLLSQYRLVTVTGPGGMGKTRLAGEVLKQVADRFADGVWVVELAGVQDAALVPAMVATTLGLQQAAGVPITEALAARLSRQQLLLVLDNCEHVLDVAAQLCAGLLMSADDIRILATSREPLGLPEEARYRLAPLAIPRQNGPGSDVQAEAVTLFIERARQLDPDLRLDGQSATVVERLVQRLDGMPLAIELAAARVEALGLSELLDRLDDRFRLLVSANRAASARQRSLEATIDWSYRLLGGAEQHVFRFLSVFPGPFTLDAAEAVAGADAGPAVLRLVDCSLLAPPRTGPDGRSRYSMLETLRGYGMRRLLEAREQHAAASALAVHALDVAERAADQMAVRSQELPAALWLDAEEAAVHQGLAWALDHDPPAALRLALALAPWWLVRGRWIEGYTLLQRAVVHKDPESDQSDRWCSAQIWLGLLSLRGGSNYSIGLAHYSAVTDELRDREPSDHLIDGLTGKSAALRNMGRLPEAAADARTAVELARRIGYAGGEAAALQELSVVSMYVGQFDEAVGWARQARLVSADLLPGWLARKVWRVLPFALVAGNRLDGTLDLCEEVLADARAAGDLSEQADALYLAAVLAMKTGRLTESGRYLREAVELALHGGYTLRLIDGLDEAGHLCAATGRYAEAVTLWSALAAQNESAKLADTLEGEDRRALPMQEASQVLGQRHFTMAQDRGTAMTLAAAVEFAVMATGDNVPVPDRAPSPLGNLSARERELVALVAQGRTDASIAEKLFISVSTVRTHLDRIRDKSGCRRRADLTRLALAEGII
ncbi:MAG TPA: LuxR C-terminal-related transcriptional regulator [Trebonia sp.]|nr:LuxR C-terminal-related transcriptional regulator [Trebonia sp.]